MVQGISPGVLALALGQQPNGNYTIYLGNSGGWQPVPGSFVEFTPAGDQVRVWTAPEGSYSDGHEFLITVDTDGQPIAHMITYTIRSVDATSRLVDPQVNARAHALVRQRELGSAPVTVWDSWNHFTLPDWIGPPRFPPNDIDHANSVTIAPVGNYIVSWRNTGEITKSIAATGAAIWRLGGRSNQFTFIGDPLGGFSAQHYVRMTPQGTILLYDNGWRHTPQQTRGVEYKLDETAKTATMIHEWRHSPLIFTQFVGSAQRLANGDTLMGWGFAGHGDRNYSPSGTTVWEGSGSVLWDAVPFFYRMLKTYSLYKDATP